MITREDEEQLLIDLSARLKYGVKVCIKLPNHEEKVFEEHVGDLLEITKSGGYLVNSKGIDYRSLSLDIKPYLRPMSSMTEDEAFEIAVLHDIKDILLVKVTSYYIDVIVDDGVCSTERRTIWYDEIVSSIKIFDWLNSHHFDYRGLIERGLALEAPEGMYNIQEKHTI